MIRSRLLAAAALLSLAAGTAHAQPRGATPMTPVSPQAPASPTAPPSPTPTTPAPGAGQATTGTPADAEPGPAATIPRASAAGSGVTDPAGGSASAYTPLTAGADIGATLKAAPQFSTLSKVAEATGLAPVLARPGLTVFAPTDAAFAASGADVSEAGLKDAANLQKLQGVLTYHVVNAVIPDFAGRAASVTAANNQKVYLDATTAGTVKVNDATALQPAVSVGSSTIYPIDKVITPGFTPPTPPPEAEAAPAPEAAPAKSTSTKTTTRTTRKKR